MLMKELHLGCDGVFYSFSLFSLIPYKFTHGLLLLIAIFLCFILFFLLLFCNSIHSNFIAFVFLIYFWSSFFLFLYSYHFLDLSFFLNFVPQHLILFDLLSNFCPYSFDYFFIIIFFLFFFIFNLTPDYFLLLFYTIFGLHCLSFKLFYY